MIERGATSGSIVGICLERSFDLVAAMLGVAKAGAAYLPLDPAYPAARLAETIADAQPLLVIGEDYVRVSELLDAAVTQLPSASLDDAAYVIYTSGSTGGPKASSSPSVISAPDRRDRALVPLRSARRLDDVPLLRL